MKVQKFGYPITVVTDDDGTPLCPGLGCCSGRRMEQNADGDWHCPMAVAVARAVAPVLARMQAAALLAGEGVE